MYTIKPTTFAWLAATALTASPAFAQDATPPPLAPPPTAPATPPTPPVPPAPPAPPAPRHGPGPRDGFNPAGPRPHGPPRDDMQMEEPRHRGPVTFLGVGVEPVPPVLVDQLNLPEGFGLIANYIVPGSPAEKAGVKPHDILKSLNDQMLISPDQLATLVHSFPEGQDVTLTLLRKGQETKLNIKLEKQTPPPMDHPGMDHPGMDHPGMDRPGMDERRARKMPFNFNGRRDRDEDNDMDFDDEENGPGMEHRRHDNAGVPPAPVPPVREILRELRPEIEEIKRAARETAEQQLRKQITILREHDGASRTTRLNLGQARIVVRDDTGELVLKVDDGKRTLLAKDAQGKVQFDGPVNTDDERKALPADVLARLEKLEHEQMPNLPPAPPTPGPEQDRPHGSPVPFMR